MRAVAAAVANRGDDPSKVLLSLSGAPSPPEWQQQQQEQERPFRNEERTKPKSAGARAKQMLYQKIYAEELEKSDGDKDAAVRGALARVEKEASEERRLTRAVYKKLFAEELEKCGGDAKKVQPIAMSRVVQEVVVEQRRRRKIQRERELGKLQQKKWEEKYDAQNRAPPSAPSSSPRIAPVQLEEESKGTVEEEQDEDEAEEMICDSNVPPRRFLWKPEQGGLIAEQGRTLPGPAPSA